jgi:hypothetical protein
MTRQIVRGLIRGRVGWLVFGASLLIMPASGHTTAMVRLADLITHPDQYDKRLVTVAGEVTNLQTATNKQGQTAYGFLLKSSNGIVKVIGLGPTDLQEGEQVIVEGVFNRLRQAGRMIVYNEIKANVISHMNRLNPDLVG